MPCFLWHVDGTIFYISGLKRVRLPQKRCCPAGSVTLPQGTEMVMPGDNITATFELISPVAMDPGLRFALREGGRTVGAGVVSKVIA